MGGSGCPRARREEINTAVPRADLRSGVGSGQRPAVGGICIEIIGLEPGGEGQDGFASPPDCWWPPAFPAPSSWPHRSSERWGQGAGACAIAERRRRRAQALVDQRGHRPGRLDHRVGHRLQAVVLQRTVCTFEVSSFRPPRIRAIGPGTRSRVRRRCGRWVRRGRRRRCRRRARSGSGRTRPVRASLASPHGAAHRRFNRSTGRCRAWRRPEPGCRWRCRRTAARHPGAAPGGSRRTPPPCPGTG
jgi:hypothetical protein